MSLAVRSIQGFSLSLPLLWTLYHCICAAGCICICTCAVLYFGVYLACPGPCFSQRPRYYHRLVLSSRSPTNTKHKHNTAVQCPETQGLPFQVDLVLCSNIVNTPADLTQKCTKNTITSSAQLVQSRAH